MAFEDLFGDLPPPAAHSSSQTSPPATSPSLMASSAASSAIIAELHPPPPPPPPAATPLSIHNDHISNHVKFKLDPAENNYTKWRMFFNLVLLQYRVQDHVTRPPPPNPDADWLAVDQRLMLWIYFTLSDTLLELIMGGAADAYTAWTRVKDYFLANQGARYLHLTRQYRNLKQGDLSVSDYARRLKALADGLADTGNPVSDHDLTMQLLHGLDNRFNTIRTILGDQVPLPPFDVARSRLDLAEYTINLRAAEAGSTALTISGGSGSPSDRGDRGERGPGGRGAGGPRGNGGGDRGRGRGRQGGRGRGRPDSGGRGSSSTPPTPWMGYFAPYGMALPAPRPGWIPPNAAGVLGPRPGVHSQAYPLMLSGPSTSSTPPAAPSSYQYPAPSWDHAALLHQAYSQHGLPPHSGDWILDSGASTHVTGTPHQDSAHDVQ